jgi:hypothetical protein
MIFAVLLLAAQPQAAQRDEQQLILVEPVRSPWARPSGVSHYRQRRVGDWRITTWRDSGAGDRVVRLQRWRPGYTLIYERYYLPGGIDAFDRAGIVVGNCAHGDRVSTDHILPPPPRATVRAALLERLARCWVAPAAAESMLQGFERAYTMIETRSLAALADAATAGD